MIAQPYRLAVLVVCGVCVLFAGCIFSRHFGIPGTLAAPGPGLYPMFVAALILIGALGTGIEAFNQKTDEALDWPQGAAARRVAIVLGAVIGYILLLSLPRPCDLWARCAPW